MRSRGLHASILGLTLGLLLAPGCGPRRAAGPDAATSDAQAPGASDAAPFDAGPVDPAFEGDVVLDDDALMALDPSALAAAPTPCRAPALVRVTWVTDGDTITVQDPTSGAEERVRIIGIDTPEIAHDSSQVDECYGPEAHAFTAPLAGHLVWLTFETGCFDRFGRTLAHVHVAAAPEASWGRQILRRGLGRTLVVSPNRAFERQLVADQVIAQSAPRGLWAACL